MFYDCKQDNFHDCIDQPVHSKAFHLAIDYQYLGNNEKGSQCKVQYIRSHEVDDMLNALDWVELIGEHEPFSTLACAVTTSQKLHKLELLQPMLLYKPIEVIKRTLETTTQWATALVTYPLQHHHASRFPWSNKSRLQEEIATDTYFCQVRGIDGSNCCQLFLGLISRMINVYPMCSKEATNVVHAYQDFMRNEGIPEGLHRDLAPEQKVDAIIDINRTMRVRDTFSEAGCPNQNLAEAMGVKIIKQGAEALMNRCGAPDYILPYSHKYIADVNNHCASPFLG